jgi:hypothetical protein
VGSVAVVNQRWLRDAWLNVGRFSKNPRGPTVTCFPGFQLPDLPLDLLEVMQKRRVNDNYTQKQLR